RRLTGKSSRKSQISDTIPSNAKLTRLSYTTYNTQSLLQPPIITNESNPLRIVCLNGSINHKKI
ncbi:hypothetical protein IGI04_007283, partial [Brassica rapa subsp. trilocularis]